MHAFYYILSASLLLFSQKEDPSVSAPNLAQNSPQIAFFAAQTVQQPPIFDGDYVSLIVLKSVKEIDIDEPSDDKNHQTDLAAIKQSIAKWSDVDKQNAEHWQRQPLLRWNNFTGQMVAAHNVPPRVLPDSSGYPTPSRDRAAADPRYPFANPPYAARVYAYVSVAQHDALLVAQYYQTKFQKLPAKSGSLAAATSGARQYPSTESAIALATVEVLKYLFPAAVAEIEEKAVIAHKAALLSGKYTETDLKIGEKIGKAVAEKVIKRAEKDGMDAAQGSEAQWQAIFKRHTEGSKIAWISKQKPARPAIEPFFGNVRGWWIKNGATFRPDAPPATDSEALQKEIALVKSSCRGQNKERMDVIMKWADAEFTPTPIGHWNTIACEMLLKNKKTDVEIVTTLAALNRAMMDAAIACWEAKTYYCYPRPSQVDPTIFPRIPLPNFPSYPSGHSVFSSTAATILSNYFPTEAENLTKMAEEASISRLYAGLHYKMDSDAGTLLGKKIATLGLDNLKK
jgi:PAP2 superfamily